jgi:hypothetical protein
VLTAEKVLIGGVDVSQFCSKAELQLKAKPEDVTNYQSQGWTEELGGLKSGALVLEFFVDFTVTTGIDFLVFNTWGLGSVQTFEVAGTQAARGTSNPSYIGNILITDWNPISGKVGSVDTSSTTWPTTAAVTRVTA